jgi:hypothetical protein
VRIPVYVVLYTTLLVTGPAIAEQPAAPKADACAKAVSPARTGHRIRDELVLIGFTISATQVVQLHHFANNDVVYPTPVWCAERNLTLKGENYTLWHNIAADGASGPFDRLVKADRSPEGAVGNVTVVADRHVAAMRKEGEAPAPEVVYDVALESEDEISLLGTYDAPLTADDMAAFASGNYVGVNAQIDKKAHKVTVYRLQ